jgi:mannose-1-phosphate guanylyltransferase / mannose-6-phosphate isomerase
LLFPVILSGGSGTRLWPTSRSSMPKQFLPLVGPKTLFQDTVVRCEGLPDLQLPIIVSNEDHRFIVAEQLRELGKGAHALLLEPVARNTAPAIAAAAFAALEADNDALLLVMPSDHVVSQPQAFRNAVIDAIPAARARRLVTFGIVPTSPETGYGYIERGQILSSVQIDRRSGSQANGSPIDDISNSSPDRAVYSVQSFKEKPNLEQAKELLAKGNFVWNAGIFLFSAKAFLDELKSLEPVMHSVVSKAFEDAKRDDDFLRLSKASFETAPSISIDYAVMEKTKYAAVRPMECGWNDVGSWSSIWEISNKDDHGNALPSNAVAIDTRNTLVSSKRVVATIGLDDVVIIDSDDALLVAHRSQVQKTKDVVDTLKARGNNSWQFHRKVPRPWGSYDSVDSSDRFQVKRITVKPGASLSLQMHHHRAEHWIVVSGTARITKGEEVFVLSENQSTYIPLGVTHRLENPGKIPLELIEVQSGSYLGEDDIVRFEDKYGR